MTDNTGRKNIKCPKCESEDLRFVNAIIQTGKDFVLLKILLAIFGLLSFVMFFITIAYLSNLAGEPKDHWEAIFAYPSAKACIYFFTAFISALILMKLIPYKTKNEIRAVCPCCGNVEKLSALLRKPGVSNNENAEEQDNGIFDHPFIFAALAICIIILLICIIFIINFAVHRA